MILELLREKWWSRVLENNSQTENISIEINSLSSEEAIDKPERKNYPLLNGKEVMIQANIGGGKLNRLEIDLIGNEVITVTKLKNDLLEGLKEEGSVKKRILLLQ